MLKHARFLSLVSAFALCTCELPTAHAQDHAPASNSEARAESTSILSEAIKGKTFSENTEITDPKLKADSGSLSRYSLKFNLTYTGPTIGDISAKDQPNPDGTVGSFQTALGGSMGLRYRIDSSSTIGVSSGVKAIHPFHGIERFDLSNPALTYDYSTRLAGVQMRTSPGFIFRTVPEFTRIGQYGYILNNHSIVYDVGRSGFSVGADMALALFLYSRDYETKDGKAPAYSIEFNPNLKYRISDKLNILTSTNLNWWNPRSRSDRFALINRSVSQRVGIGYSFTRDVYLNPYLAFFPQRLALSNTTVNFTTIFSVF